MQTFFVRSQKSITFVSKTNGMSNKERLIGALKSELFEGRSAFDWLFLATGLAVQLVVFFIHGDGYLSLVSGITGIFSVILCSQGKISTFFFGFIQIITYLILVLGQNLYAEVGLNIFYLLSQFYGIYAWRKRYKISEDTTAGSGLDTRRLSTLHFALIVAAVIMISWLLGYLLRLFTNDTQPYLDSFTTIPAIAAQILMVTAHREQWFLWLSIDVLCVILWIRAGDWCLAAQYCFWCANCIYGLRKWNKRSV